MKKIILGAGAALALLGARANAQAPIVPATEVPQGGMPSAAPYYGGEAPQAGAFDMLSRNPGLVGSGPVNTPARFYTEASYLLMFASDAKSSQPILTGGPSNGVLGRPGTSLLAGGDGTSYGTMSGFKVGFGGLVGATSVGFEANVMVLGRVSDQVTFGPTSATTLARPFFDSVNRRESAIVLASPGAFTGAIDINNSLSAWGFEANPFFRLVQGNTVSFDVITGFRYFSADEKLDIYDSRTVQAGGVTAFNGIGVGNGASLVVHDKFSSRNQFYGGNIGGRLSYSRGGLFVDFTGKVAIGGVHQTVNVDGTTTLVSGGGLVGPATTPGGFLANPAVSGERTSNRFAVLPEANLQLGYQLTSWLNVFGGYQVIYFSNVARASEQFDSNINPNQLPTVNTYTSRGLTTLMMEPKTSDLFLHGFNFGLTVTY